jgi:hypothetical protein
MANAIESLGKPDQAPQDDDFSSSRVILVADAAPASADDSGQALFLFALFIVAVLMVTCAVGFLALLTSWWVLGVVFGIHVVVTAIVGTAVFSVLSSGSPRLDGDNVVQLGVATNPEASVPSHARSTETSPLAA